MANNETDYRVCLRLWFFLIGYTCYAYFTCCTIHVRHANIALRATLLRGLRYLDFSASIRGVEAF